MRLFEGEGAWWQGYRSISVVRFGTFWRGSYANRESNRITELETTPASQQAQATEEISSNIQSAASGMTSVSGDIRDVTHMAGETEHASSQVAQATQELARQSQGLKAQVERFLSNVRSA